MVLVSALGHYMFGDNRTNSKGSTEAMSKSHVAICRARHQVYMQWPESNLAHILKDVGML